MEGAESAATPPRPAITVAVVLERERAPNRYEDWRFRIVDVVPNEDAFGSAPRVLRDDGKVQRTLHPGFVVELYRDQAQGYHLNLASGAPVWLVVGRSDDNDPSRGGPETVRLS